MVSEILPGRLYLSSFRGAEDFAELERIQIAAILSFSPTRTRTPPVAEERGYPFAAPS